MLRFDSYLAKSLWLMAINSKKVSRGFIDNMDWDIWNNPVRSRTPIHRYYEDVLMGRYISDMKGNVTLIQHHGISQVALTANSGHSKLVAEFRGKPWPMPFRPLAYHQSGVFGTMHNIHSLLHSNEYYPPAEFMFDLPPCLCKPEQHSRCMWNLKAKGRPVCRWDGLPLHCLGPGAYTNLGYEQMSEKKRKDLEQQEVKTETQTQQAVEQPKVKTETQTETQAVGS